MRAQCISLREQHDFPPNSQYGLVIQINVTRAAEMTTRQYRGNCHVRISFECHRRRCLFFEIALPLTLILGTIVAGLWLNRCVDESREHKRVGSLLTSLQKIW